MDQDHTASREVNDETDEFDVLEALYQLNIVAKEYAESAGKSYEQGFKRRARIHSQRKKALYSLKTSILKQFVNEDRVDTVRTHRIDNRKYYCVYIGEFSYHTPVSEWDAPPLDAPENATKLDSFNADPTARTNKLTERDSLTILSNKFESPNKHLEHPFTSDNFGGSFVGWSYLPDALEEGDKVPEHRLYDHNGEGDFLFEVGDTFTTGEGPCEIVDRYHAYLTPLYDRSPLLQKPVYDVVLDGDEKTRVRQQRIIDDWWVLAENLQNPLPNVNGKLSTHTHKHINNYLELTPEIEVGDILELEPLSKNAEPEFCRLVRVTVSVGVLMGEYEPIPPSQEAPLGLSISEIMDAVVAVHESPPNTQQ